MTCPKDERAEDGESTWPNPGSVLQDEGRGASTRDSSVEMGQQGGWTGAAAGFLWISLRGLKAAGQGPGRQKPMEQVSPWQQWCSHQDALAVAAKSVPVIKRTKGVSQTQGENCNTRSQEEQDLRRLGIIRETAMWGPVAGMLWFQRFSAQGSSTPLRFKPLGNGV